MADYDVIVVGAGNAALSAAVSARVSGASRVLVLEKAPEDRRGGNTHFSGGLLRYTFEDKEQAIALIPDVEKNYPEYRDGIDPYPAKAFREDIMKVTGGRSDPQLSDILINQSYPTVRWMQQMGIAMEPARSSGGEWAADESAIEGVRRGKGVRWQPGCVIRAVGQGKGLSKAWFASAEQKGVEVRYDACALRLTQAESGKVNGVIVREQDGIKALTAKAVVLGSGGFEANTEWRVRYLGGHWGAAKVRGCAFNHGDGLRMALELGALPFGDWRGCHATPISQDAPAYADPFMTDKTNRLSYVYGVMLNLEGKRFLDEGYDVHPMTYALYGGLILGQPEGQAYQIFDAKVVHLLEGRYATEQPVSGDTLQSLFDKIRINKEQALKTIREYNEAAGHGTFVPTKLDGMHTQGLTPPKTNWAQRLDKGPFVAYPVTGGITFTFGGLKINEHAQVIANNWKPLPGLFCCGEAVGGIFHGNYPAGTGLMAGAVFGRIAGASAAKVS
jgi:tricarballylate dehydrogenase